jgi:signal transduction histidine kinase
MEVINSNQSKVHEEQILINKLFLVVRTIGVFGVSLVLFSLWHSGLLWYDPKPIFFYLVPIMLLSSFVWRVLIKNPKFSDAVLTLQLFVDEVLIALGIYFSGAGHSALHILILVPVFSAALVSRRAVVIIFVLATLSMLTMAFGEYSLLLLPPGKFAEMEGLFTGGNNFFRPSWVIAVAALVSFQGFYFISTLKRRDKELTRLKDEFFFRTVHDLRSPLTALRWLTEKYKKQPENEANKELKKDIGVFYDLEINMLELVKGALAVSRGQSEGQFETKEKFDAGAFIESLIRPYRASASQNKITLNYNSPSKPLELSLNKDLVKEIVVNLLDNAIKYNRPQGKIDILLKQVNQNKMLLEISDTGLGISQEGMQKLFTPYFRDSNVKTLTGTGLGLYLVKKLIEKSGGSIKVDSVLNQGTKFVVTI